MTDSATWLLARSIMRRNLRATVFLALFVALAGAAAMTAWEYSRRATTVIERRIDRVRPADGVLNTCPPGEDPGVDITPCFAVESNRIAFDVLRASPYVDASSLLVSAKLEVSASPNGPTFVAFGSATVEQVERIGEPVVVSGRTSAADASSEIELSETLARRLGVRAGSTVWVSGCAFDFGGESVDCAPAEAVVATGIVRLERDLLPVRRPPPGATLTDDTDFGVFAGRGWYDDFLHRYSAFPQTSFRLAQGATLDDVRADVEARLPDGWTVLVAPPEDRTTFDGLRRSTDLQAGALLAIATILGLAGAVFVAQALVRQVRKELAEHAVVSALGMTNADLVRIALARVAPIAAAGSLLAVGAAVVASAHGPPSLAGRAEVDPGVRIDPTVLLLGGVVVVAFVVAIGALAAARSLRSSARSSVVGARSTSLSATASAGSAIGRASSAGSGGRVAVLGVAAAVAGGDCRGRAGSEPRCRHRPAPPVRRNVGLLLRRPLQRRVRG